MSVEREMSLAEWCAKLPNQHKVNQELAVLNKQLAALTEQNKQLKAELKSIDGALDDPRVNLTLTASEIIWELKEQIERLTKERDALKTVPMKYRRMQFNAELQDEVTQLQKQLLALAEQNEKMCVALQAMVDEAFARNCGLKIADDALSLPNLASPVLNRIRAEGMRMAAEICAQLTSPTKLSDPGRSWINGTLDCEKAIRARAAELENEDAN